MLGLTLADGRRVYVRADLVASIEVVPSAEAVEWPGANTLVSLTSGTDFHVQETADAVLVLMETRAEGSHG